MSWVVARYEEMLASGELRPDPDQRTTIEQLDRLAVALVKQTEKGGLLSRIMGKTPVPVRGLYMWGGVGRG
ncbi:MAG: cell division protein ZapE, partial [Alphaproteobacteria bacterium]